MNLNLYALIMHLGSVVALVLVLVFVALPAELVGTLVTVLVGLIGAGAGAGLALVSPQNGVAAPADQSPPNGSFQEPPTSVRVVSAMPRSVSISTPNES